MLFLGDIHGQYNKIPKTNYEKIIQVGDFGIGFEPYEPRDNVLFIRGNHDDPERCHRTKGYLGDYGTFGVDGQVIGYISGADSVDKERRLLGVSWWDNEQLSYKDMFKAIDLMVLYKPEIMITHDCPSFLTGIKTPTSTAFDYLFELINPKYWIFGHHHRRYRRHEKETYFVGLEINELWWIGRD